MLYYLNMLIGFILVSRISKFLNCTRFNIKNYMCGNLNFKIGIIIFERPLVISNLIVK